ncbi:MAG: NAD(P)-dependent oxidoreductase [Planctomycetes bacterium]|nr:NAD(P)-dependent oxidoreductase [Planctomycetota bacterium]MBM4078327.1 NAD(P)-dependent oxidoreductase [Planctomycetota bacterium]
MNKEIGLVGLGLLGSVLAERFVAAGFRVVGYDIDATRFGALAALGLLRAHSPCDVAQKAKRIVLSLPNSDVVETVVEGKDGIVFGATSETVIIDTTTADPVRTAKLAERLRERGIAFVDATISGSSRMARDGQALVMAGGDAEAVKRQSDILNAVSPRMFHVGPNGKGAETKLLVNLVLGLNRLVLAEGLAMGIRAGVAPEKLLEVLKASAAYSQIMDTKGPNMIARGATVEARLRQHLKDVRLVLEMGERLSARLPLSRLHAELLSEAVEAGFGDLDNSAIINVFLPTGSQ